MAPLRIKICGVTTVADGLAAARLGADLLGLNFYLSSPRFVDLQVAEAILDELPPAIEPVAVVVNESITAVAKRIDPLTRLRTIQFHGNNPEIAVPDAFQQIVAFAVRDIESLRKIADYLERC